MPGFHHPVLGALGGDGQAVELARQADREVADVDHLLHLAQALGADLAGLDRHQPSELRLELAQLLAQQAHQLTATRRRHGAPSEVGRMRAPDLVGHRAGVVLGQARGFLAGQRRARGQGAAGQGGVVDAEPRQDLRRFRGHRRNVHLVHGAVFPVVRRRAGRRPGWPGLRRRRRDWHSCGRTGWPGSRAAPPAPGARSRAAAGDLRPAGRARRRCRTRW